MNAAASSSGDWWLCAVPFLPRNTGLSPGNEEAWSITSSWAPYGFLFMISAIAALVRWAAPGGCAWGALSGSTSTIPGPRGWPIVGSLMEMGGLAHKRLAELARAHSLSLMALSLGNTRVVITSTPEVARELLNSPAFADRPLKQSAQQLLFGRAIGFAPYGEYWRNLRRIAANHLFSPKRIAAHEELRQRETSEMLKTLECNAASGNGCVHIRSVLQRASLNNIMGSVFGKRYEFGSNSREAGSLQDMVREGFDLLGAFNWADHLPILQAVDPQKILNRCAKLVPRVNAFVQDIIDEHRQHAKTDNTESDFVDVLLSFNSEDKIQDSDMIAVLWEMIFRGTDTTAILTEWILAELVLHPEIQRKIQKELDAVVGVERRVRESDISKLPYLQAVIKETLRLHPPGPLLSWSRLATHDVTIAGHRIPSGTTAMVNMWAITHDSNIWSDPDSFKPERFMVSAGGMDVDIRGNDLRLAPFGAGRRVCPGRALGLATVQLWVARLLHHFEWHANPLDPVDLAEVLKLSCEMVTPLSVRPVRRMSLPF
ncbi:hypothetical protein O6H91_05G106700 [Diphasiastrum complanatum]|uniref:Uncharacterized protein n=2 Tax=Diphasiastrum complanatum TaxID=34168 RepID=A0ACC2DNQ6_DIPCM|nr:hypothetical protein O6H91_05G061600 [Diphasiastrum complanatum]KAJ7556975.1 hypothetical protein O6H91_05G106700 [Diphasiastrum complanatum]